jgi:hypothetical protein
MQVRGRSGLPAADPSRIESPGYCPYDVQRTVQQRVREAGALSQELAIVFTKMIMGAMTSHWNIDLSIDLPKPVSRTAAAWADLV